MITTFTSCFKNQEYAASTGEEFVPRFGNGFIFPWNSGARQNVALIFEDPLFLCEGYKT